MKPPTVEYNCTASVLFGAITMAGRPSCSMTLAIVNALPDSDHEPVHMLPAQMLSTDTLTQRYFTS